MADSNIVTMKHNEEWYNLFVIAKFLMISVF